MKRYGAMVGISPEGKEEYRRLHADVWPGVLDKIRDCNISNYSIFLNDAENVMFARFDYHGDDFEADMARMAADPETQRWWAINMPLQRPLDSRKPGEWWSEMDEIFRME